MNTTIAKVIAFELGVLIAILTWLAVAGLPGTRPGTTAEMQAPADDAFATVSPIYQPKTHRPYAVDYPAEAETVAPEDAAPIQTVQTYTQEVADGSDASSGVEGYTFAEDPASSVGIYPEPVLTDPYCLVSPYDQVVAYPQIIVFSNNRSFPRHQRMAPRMHRPRLTAANPRPHGRDMRGRGGRRVVSRRPNIHTRSARPMPGRNLTARAAQPSHGTRGRTSR